MDETIDEGIRDAEAKPLKLTLTDESGAENTSFQAYRNFFNTSSGAAAYVLGVIEQLARPWLRLRMALE